MICSNCGSDGTIDYEDAQVHQCGYQDCTLEVCASCFTINKWWLKTYPKIVFTMEVRFENEKKDYSYV